jgi:hypothetical protein
VTGLFAVGRQRALMAPLRAGQSPAWIILESKGKPPRVFDQCFRGSVAVSGGKRPARHLVAVAAKFAKTKPGADREGARTILCDDGPVFVLCRVAWRYGLPVALEWAQWFMCELNQRKAIQPLAGLECSPVLVSKPTFLKWIGKRRNPILGVAARPTAKWGTSHRVSR